MENTIIPSTEDKLLKLLEETKSLLNTIDRNGLLQRVYLINSKIAEHYSVDYYKNAFHEIIPPLRNMINEQKMKVNSVKNYLK
jgi:hypothetical protein